ncbi:unnamed protein product [Rotaria magnacalcarata]|uniref:Uncharacterized protein n=5 Tax=Rotaria magnacalcarata TaxID=392030 RepID=A0A814GGL9_9BILA|nr:unnamed protein product [Rotaria magnacalcarata]
MNLMMQQRPPYPLYLSRPRLPLSMPWSAVPFRLPTTSRFGRLIAPYSISRPLSQVALPQQPNLQPRITSPFPSYSNRRYQHLKHSASYPNRNAIYRSLDAPKREQHHRTYANDDVLHTHEYRPSKTKSVSDIEYMSQISSTRLSKANSWHTMNHHRKSNLSVAYANEARLTPKRRRKHSPHKKIIKQQPPNQVSSLPRRNPSFIKRKIRPMTIPECGIVRISTLDEMPLDNNQQNKKTNSINNDRLSMKGSISNSSKRRNTSKENNSIKNRNAKKNNEHRTDIDTASLLSSSSSSLSSNPRHSPLQRRLNVSLRNDPLITAAMEDFRRFRRSPSQNTSLTSRGRNLSLDSLCSDSTLCSSRRSRSHSQSSFTSVERSEIRELIKTIKNKDAKTLNISIPTTTSTSIPIPVSSPEPSMTIYTQTSARTNKPKKSFLTEELDREFNKLRARDPNQELTYVTPSSICKRKKTLEKPSPNIPPAPAFTELLRQVQLRPVDKSARPQLSFNEKSPTQDHYPNPLSCIPVPRSSPIPRPEVKIEEPMHEYAIPIKKSEGKPAPKICQFQPMRNLSIHKQTLRSMPENPPSHSAPSHIVPSFNWSQCGLTNQMPSTFQPKPFVNNQNEHVPTVAKENIYTSDIDLCLPLSTVDKNHEDALQAHLDDHTILTDDLYSDFGTKQTVISSSIVDDFSLLFKRKHKHENQFTKKTQRCSIM